jgi:hypothetical protein
VKAAVLFDAIRRDVPPCTPAAKPTTAAGSSPLIVKPGNINIRVFNGSGINGLGRKAFGELGNMGFQTVGTATTRGTGASATVVLYGPSKADSARTVAAAIPGSTLKASPDLGNVIEVVVGTSYKGVQAVTVTSATPSTAPSASTAPKVVTALDDPCAA